VIYDTSLVIIFYSILSNSSLLGDVTMWWNTLSQGSNNKKHD